MAKYCIFRIDGSDVTFFEHYDDYASCARSREYLDELAILRKVSTRYIIRKLDDWEDPYTYNPFLNVIIL